MTAVVEEVVRKLGEQALIGEDIRSQADLALAVHHRLPLGVLKGLAQAGLTEQEKRSYDLILATNDLNIIKLAAQGLKARYSEAMGKDPSLVLGGSTAGGNDGLGVFASRAEMVRAMQDPRYASDPAYRAKVERKVINSNI